MITLSNTTRVAGALLLIQDSIQSMHALCHYITKSGNFEPKNLTHAEWKQVVKFEAIMRRAHLLCFDSQGDHMEVATEMILQLALLKVHYEEDTMYDVVDTGRIGGQFCPLMTFTVSP